VTSSKIKFSKNVRVFTEKGVAMLSSVLRSKRSIQVNIQIMRTFSNLHRMLETHKDLKRKIEEMELIDLLSALYNMQPTTNHKRCEVTNHPSIRL
jgi:hypothetical protein